MRFIPEEHKELLKAKFAKRWIEVPSGCRIWQGDSMQGGYGRFHVRGRRELAHRVAWMLFVGEIEAGCGVFHHCDTPACVNRLHLFSGPQQDNLVDMARKGRHGLAKVTPAQAGIIKHSQSSVGALAHEYQISPQTVWHIKAGRTHNY